MIMRFESLFEISGLRGSSRMDDLDFLRVIVPAILNSRKFSNKKANDVLQQYVIGNVHTHHRALYNITHTQRSPWALRLLKQPRALHGRINNRTQSAVPAVAKATSGPSWTQTIARNPRALPSLKRRRALHGRKESPRIPFEASLLWTLSLRFLWGALPPCEPPASLPGRTLGVPWASWTFLLARVWARRARTFLLRCSGILPIFRGIHAAGFANGVNATVLDGSWSQIAASMRRLLSYLVSDRKDSGYRPKGLEGDEDEPGATAVLFSFLRPVRAAFVRCSSFGCSPPGSLAASLRCCDRPIRNCPVTHGVVATSSLLSRQVPS